MEKTIDIVETKGNMCHLLKKLLGLKGTSDYPTPTNGT
jgi:hypothetical protein